MIEGRDFAAASTIGARARQEDDWGTHLNPPALENGAGLLAAVADGMGGMPAGAQASDIALRAFLDSYPAINRPARERLRHALAHANREVGIAVEANPDIAGMGCTLVAALFFPDRCQWLSIGDSLILHCRNGHLERINPLHVYANDLEDMVRRGALSNDAAASHPDRAALTSAIQGSVLRDVAQGERILEAGDVVVLASDGVATLNDTDIASICVQHAGADVVRIAETIIECIDAQGKDAQDNATVIVVRHGDAEEDTLIDQKGEVLETAHDIGEADVFTAETSPKATNAETSLAVPDENGSPDITVPGAGERANETGTDSSATEPRYSEPAVPPAPRKPQAGRPIPGVRILWLAMAFALGGLCGIARLVRFFPGISYETPDLA